MQQTVRRKGKIFYGWVIVAVSSVIQAMAYGVYHSWPAFYVAILDESGWTRAHTALIFSTASMVYGFSSVVVGALFDRFGPRKLFIPAAIVIAIGAVGCSQSGALWQFCIFYGFFVGFGACAAGFIPNIAMVSNWFSKRRATALGIALVGTREAYFLVPLIQAGILALGWRSVYPLLAIAVASTIIPLSLLLRARPQDMGLLPDGETKATVDNKREPAQAKRAIHIVDKKWASTEWTLIRAIKEHRWWALLIIMVSSGFAVTSVLSHHMAMITDLGFSDMFAAYLLTLFAVAAILGRFGSFFSDIFGREKVFTLASAGVIFALTMVMSVKTTSAAWMLYVYIICLGFFSGMYIPAYSAAAADLFQGKGFGAILGLANIGYGMGGAIGTWLYGRIFDVTGSYHIAFVIAITFLCAQIMAMWVAAPRKVRLITRK